jgi:hypothetical protein
MELREGHLVVLKYVPLERVISYELSSPVVYDSNSLLDDPTLSVNPIHTKK